MEPTEKSARRVIRIPIKKSIVFIVFVLILVLAIGFVVLTSLNSARMSYDVGDTAFEDSLILPSEPYHDGREDLDITDTREFLKVRYYSQIKTRDVHQTVRNVKSIIHESEGRIDNETSSEKRGYVSFVVPKSEFEDFRKEVESLTHKKLYTETVSSENLLGQKQNIEQQMQVATSSLASLEQQKETLDTQHDQVRDMIVSELTTKKNRLSTVRQLIQNIEDEERLIELRLEEGSLLSSISRLEQELVQEDKSYAKQATILVAQINKTQDKVDQVEERDNQFANNIETVNGRVNVNWVSYWGLAKIFSPIHPSILIVILVLIGWYILYRRGHTPKIELV